MEAAARLERIAGIDGLICGLTFGKADMISKLFKKPQAKTPPSLAVSDVTAPEPSLWEPVSQACTQAQMEEPHYSHWCSLIREAPRMHRKQWEFAYILQALHMHDMVEEGRRGLGFGVGREPLAAVFANRDVEILATDMTAEAAAGAGWIATNQHIDSKLLLNERGICDQEKFDRLVDFRFMDMNKIDRSLHGQFDFTWSACAFEHLGSIAQGLEFVANSVKCLKPGGIAVHTTEFNCSSNDDTVDNNPTVLFRKRDFEQLEQRLRKKGWEIEFNFNLGDKPLDLYVDVAPFKDNQHLKLQIEEYTVTSFGILVRRP